MLLLSLVGSRSSVRNAVLIAVRVQGNEMAVVRDNKTIVQPVVSSTVIYLVTEYGKALLSR